jgi:hypothetical protein
MTSVQEQTTDRVEGRRLQRALDEIAFLERNLDQAWPDPRRIRAELEAGERELSALRAEVRVLEGPRRFVDLALSSAWAAAVAFWIVAACILVGGR